MWLWRLLVRIQVFTHYMNNEWEIYYTPKTSSTYVNYKIISLLTNSVFINRNVTSKLFLLQNLLNVDKKFFFLYKNLFKTNSLGTNFKINKKNFTIDKVSLSHFLKLTTVVTNKSLSVHPSFTNYYYYTSRNKCVINIKKLTNLWGSVITFLSNLFYFNLRYLTFSNSYFKYEVLALNWKVSNSLTNIWRFTNSFIFFISNKMTLKTEFCFRHFLSEGFRCSFIIDLYYHKSTIYYSNKFKFITIGPVPLTSNLYTFYLSIPTTSNSAFSNLIFIRLLLKLKKVNTKLIWKNFKTNL